LRQRAWTTTVGTGKPLKMRHLLAHPEKRGEPVVGTLEDPITKQLRVKQVDMKRLMRAIKLPLHTFFKDPTMAFLVEHYMRLFAYCAFLFTTPTLVLEVYDATGPELVKELRGATVILRRLSHVLRPPLADRRTPEEGFEEKHKAPKGAAHKQRMRLLFALQDLAVVDLMDINDRSQHDPIRVKVERNMKATFHPRALMERRAERSAANASIAILSRCIALADAPPVVGAPQAPAGVCPDEVVRALKNMYVEPGQAPPFPAVALAAPEAWVAPFFLNKGVVFPKEARPPRGGAAHVLPDSSLTDDDYGQVIAEREDDDDTEVSDATGPDDMGEGPVDDDEDDYGIADSAGFATACPLGVREDVLEQEAENDSHAAIEWLMGDLGLGPDDDADDQEIATAARAARTEVGRRLRIPNQRYNDYVR